jgi:hypothetical protein
VVHCDCHGHVGSRHEVVAVMLQCGTSKDGVVKLDLQVFSSLEGKVLNSKTGVQFMSKQLETSAFEVWLSHLSGRADKVPNMATAGKSLPISVERSNDSASL